MVVGHHGVRGGVGAGRRSLSPAGGANNGSGPGQGGTDARSVCGRGAGGGHSRRPVGRPAPGWGVRLAGTPTGGCGSAGRAPRCAPPRLWPSPTRSIAQSHWSPPATCAPTAVPPRISPLWRGAARSVGAQVLVDASHSTGILPLAAERLQIDFVVAAAYKHLLCPRGSGVPLRRRRDADAPGLDRLMAWTPR